MYNKSINIILLVVIILIVLLSHSTDTHAIPAFSREHNTECATCHTIFPELNEYGDVFMKNGFVWNKKNRNGSTAKGEINTSVRGEGDPEILLKLKKQAALSPATPDEPLLGAQRKSEPLWLAGLPQTAPISLAATLNASYDDKSISDKIDLSTRAVSLLAGGVFKDKLGFFLKYNLYSEGAFNPAVSNTPTNMDPPYANDLEEFYLVWRNTFGSPVNLKIGRFRPKLSLWKKTNKTGISDFATTHFSIKSSTFTSDSPEDAIEANAVLFNRVFLAGGLVDRNGQESNEGYGHLSFKLGGSDFRANEPDIDLDKESIFDYMYMVLGGYAYTGRNSGSLASNQRNNFFRGGVEIDFVVMNARMKLAWANGRDANPDFTSHLEEITDVYAAQGEYMLSTDLLALFRFEYQEMNDGTIYKRYIPAISYSPLQNTKVTLEYQNVVAENSLAKQTSDILLLGIRVAF